MTTIRPTIAAILASAGFVAACGSSGSGGSPVGPTNPTCTTGTSFESTFDAVQQVVFDGQGCTTTACHSGASPSAGLDLTAGNSWASLHDVASRIDPAEKRVLPGSPTRSILYQKLAAATLGEKTKGSPMPIGRAPLSENDLNLVRWWIYGGAPEDGVVNDATAYVPGCLPDPKPLQIKPLDPPAPGTGVQLVMPTFNVPASSESERCFASYFDVCDQVPPELLSKVRGYDMFAFDSRELRMDPGSHHLILNFSVVSPDRLDDPSYGGFTCHGGEREGETCDPRDLAACPGGGCASAYREGFTCSGFGPAVPGQAGFTQFPIGGAQRAQDFQQYPDGVYNQIPCRGILLWNPHNFNLTAEDQMTNARLNYYFADPAKLQYPGQGRLTGPIFRPNAAPFTKETYCADFTLPRGGRLYQLSSHTHKRGELFWVNMPDGTKIYENVSYNDPQEERYEPPLAFDSEVTAERTLEFCATYNNGVSPDGTPNVETVTRASRIPPTALETIGACSPVACVNEGAVGRACKGESDDATCDTAPGKADGDCDACRITGGESTENEMFLLIPGYYQVPVS
ncbi:MAG: hypothetical protein ACKPBU_02270 [Alphaproteobacteria bacterium]